MAADTSNASVSDLVGWTAGPETRGTLMLVWSCVITIFACTWTVLHLNVPGRDEGSFTISLRKIKWTAVNILFPEFIFAKAVCDLRLALEELRGFDEYVRNNQEERENLSCKWTVSVENMSHEWSWEFEYPVWSQVLYRLLGLTPPLQDPKQKQLPLWILKLRSFLRFNIKSSENQIDIEAQTETDLKNRRLAGVGTHLTNQVQATGLQQDSDTTSSNRTQPVNWRTVQKWTVVHSYYAQMGGILYPDSCKKSQDVEPIYYCCTGFMLTSKNLFTWRIDRQHPFHRLILGERDIKDKSKADWVLKGIAVAQVSWLILGVTVRSVTHLPITQLEIATISSAVMAILSYVANWWKPKDISYATILETPAEGLFLASQRPEVYPQSFLLRLLSPLNTQKEIHSTANKLQRVPNDFVWVGGHSSLMISLMAVSSFVFGGLHCLAWNFEFPTEAELVCWRVAAVISAMLPAITLGISLAIHFLSTTYVRHKLVSLLLRKLEPLNGLLPEFWSFTQHPIWNYHPSWSQEAKLFLIRAPAESRDWDKQPSKEAIAKQAEPGPDETPYEHYERFHAELHRFTHQWTIARETSPYVDMFLYDMLFRHGSRMQHYSKSKGVVEFWQEYEDFIKTKHNVPTPNIPGTSCTAFIVRAFGEVADQLPWWKRFEKVCEKASLILTIVSGVIYTVARLTILVLLFTSLRETPAGVYQVTPWLNFLPNFS